MSITEPNKPQSNQPATKTQTLQKELKNGRLFIGIPKEITYQENRVPLTPSAVQHLSAQGHRIVMEKGAGANANFSDISYSESGAEICPNPKDIYQADIVLKVAPPTKEEINFLQAGQILISALQVNNIDEECLKMLMSKRINALAYEFLEDDNGTLPIIRAMSEIAGTASILIAAEYLNNTHVGKGELLGGFAGIPPTQIVIIGAGAVGEFATKAALGLGANVKVFDNHLHRLRRMQQHFGQHIYTSTIHPKGMVSAMEGADVVIGALRGKSARSPMIITNEMMSHMRAHSVIIDVAIDHGGNFECSTITTHEDPIRKINEVIYYGVPNIASRVGRTASYALSNVFSPLIDDMTEFGGFSESLRAKSGLRRGTYLFKGNLTNKNLADKFNLKYHDMDLIAGIHY
jgi:alanine dehydrogenase